MIRIFFLLPLLLASNVTDAETIVRFYFQQGVIENTVDLKLYDVEKPGTVNNFMSYVNDGSYTNSFVHRTLPGFIMQGGRYEFDINNTDFLTSFSKILAKPSIINEPGISNIRGTIAMAKIPGKPDSATSEWFFNLANNSADLDFQNEGFTVFGKVINDGMQVIDVLAGVPLFNLGGAFTDIPFVDYILNDPIITSNLVKVNRIEGLFKISSDYFFEKPTASVSDQAVFFIENISNQALNIGDINKTNTVETPFVIINDGCNNSSLLPGEVCTFNVSFNPVKLAVYSDDINISFPDIGMDYKINVSGSGGIYNITPNYDYGTVTPGSNLQPEFFIENISNADLVIGDMGNIDPINKPFSIRSARCINWVLSPGKKCKFVVVFRPKQPGTFSDSFNIEFPELNFNHTMNLTGIGGVPENEPDIIIAFTNKGLRSADFGDLDLSSNKISQEYTVEIAYQNLGIADLFMSEVSLITSQPDEFSLADISDSCLEKGSIGQLEACFQTITFTPSSVGEKKAILRIVSNDPDERVFDYTVIANVLAENDGVDKTIEDAGPNNGDANYDGIADSEQSNVVTLPNLNGEYVNYIGDPGMRFSQVKFTDRNNYPNIPDQVALSTGVFEFTIEEIQMDNLIRVGIILPASMKPKSFYIFGPTEKNSEPHWDELSFDGETGSVILSGGSYVAANGQMVSGTFVTLYLKNGSRGDSTFDTDNELKVIGGFAGFSDGESSGRLDLIELVLMILIMIIFRYYTQHLYTLINKKY